MTAPRPAFAWASIAILLAASFVVLAAPAASATAAPRDVRLTTPVSDAQDLPSMASGLDLRASAVDATVTREEIEQLLTPAGRHALRAERAAALHALGLPESPARLGMLPHPAGGPLPKLLAPPGEGDASTAAPAASARALALEDPTTRVLALRVQFQPDSDTCTATNGVFLPTHGDAYFEDLLVDFVDYYEENSYGALSPDVDLSPVYTLPASLPEYGFDFDFFGISYFLLLYDAIQAADEDIDFSEYDHVLVFHAGSGHESDLNEDSPCDVHSAYLPPEAIGSIASFFSNTAGIPTNDGVVVDDATFMPETHDQDGLTGTHILGVLAHEYGHQLGLPDLYDRSYETVGGVGDWSLMASGSYNGNGAMPAHLDAWSKIELGWITPTIVDAPTSGLSITLDQVETTPEVYLIPADGDLGARKSQEYFLVENRQLAGYDAALPGHGVLLWHIDESVLELDQNDWAAHRFLELVEADGDHGLDAGYGDPSDTWVAPLSFTGTRSVGHAGIPTGVTLTDISASGASMSMTIVLDDALAPDVSPPSILYAIAPGVEPGGYGLLYLEATDDREVIAATMEIAGETHVLSRFATLDGYSWADDDFPDGRDSTIFVAFVEFDDSTPTAGEIEIWLTDGTNAVTDTVPFESDVEPPQVVDWSVSTRTPWPDETFTVSGHVSDDRAVVEAYLYAYGPESEVEVPLTVGPDGSFSIGLTLDDLSETLDEGYYWLYVDVYDTANFNYDYLGAMWISEAFMDTPYIEFLVGPENEANGHDASNGYVAKVNAFYDGAGTFMVEVCDYWGYTIEDGDIGGCFGSASPGSVGIVTITRSTPAEASEVGTHVLVAFPKFDGQYMTDADGYLIADGSAYLYDIATPTFEQVTFGGLPLAQGNDVSVAANTRYVLSALPRDDAYEADLVNYPDDDLLPEFYFSWASYSYGAHEDWPLAFDGDALVDSILTSSRGISGGLEITVYDLRGHSSAFAFELVADQLGEVEGQLRWQGRALPGYELEFTNGAATVGAITDETGAFQVPLAPGTWTLQDDLEGPFHLAAPLPFSVTDGMTTEITPTVASELGGIQLQPVLPTGVTELDLTLTDADDVLVDECVVEAAGLTCEEESDLFDDMLLALEPGIYTLTFTSEETAPLTLTHTVEANKAKALKVEPRSAFGFVELSVKNKLAEVPLAWIAFLQDDETVAACELDVAARDLDCDGVATDDLKIRLPEGTYTVVAEASDMKPIEKTGLAVASGKTVALPLTFALAVAPVKINLKTAAVTQYTLELVQSDELVGLCEVDADSKLAECDSEGAARASTWPTILVDEGTYDVVATPAIDFEDDYKPFEKVGMKFVAGKAASIDVTFALLKAPLTVMSKTKEIEAFQVRFLDADDNEVGVCEFDVAAKDVVCDGDVSAGSAFPIVLVPEDVVFVEALPLGDQEADYKGFQKAMTFTGGKAAKLDVTFALKKAPLTVTLKTKEVEAFALTFYDADENEVGACELDVVTKDAICDGDVSAGAKFGLVLVPEGALTVEATVLGDQEDDYKLFTKQVTFTGGKAAKLDLTFTLVKAPVSFTFKAPLADEILLEFELDGALIGECWVYQAGKEMECDGDVSSTKWATVLVPEGTVTLYASADGHDDVEQTLKLVGGKAAKATVTLTPDFALLAVTVSNLDLDEYEFDLIDGDGATVATCYVYVEDEDAECDSDDVWLDDVEKAFLFHVPASGAEKWSAVFRAAGEQEHGAPDVTLTKLALAGGKVVAAKVAFKPNMLKVTVKGTGASTADILLEDADGRVFESIDKATATFGWVAAGLAHVSAQTDDGLTGEVEVTVVAAKTTSATVAVS